MIRRILLLLVCCLAVFAQKSGPASVAGWVANSVTGDPILRAHVTLQTYRDGNPPTEQNYGALTDADGKFSISGLAPGWYRVKVERIGFVGTDPYSGPSITLADGEKKDDLKFSLIPTGAITGRVLNEHGEPMSRIAVHADQIGFAVTDEQGRYRIGGLAPGKYRVRAILLAPPFDPEIRSDGTRPVHYSTTYYPNPTEKTSAPRLEVPAGTTLSGIDIRLASTPMVVVSGKISGAPAGADHITVRPVRAGEIGFESEHGVKADGTFAIAGLDPGKYRLIATVIAPGRLPNFQIGEMTVEVGGANVEHVDLQAVLPFEVKGQVRFEDEKLRTPHKEQDQPAQPRRIDLRPAEPYGENTGSELPADDSFMLKDIVAARYRVVLSWPAGYVRSIRAGNTETEGNILDLTHGPPGPVLITMSSDTCEVSGTVNDGNGPVASVRVALLPDGGSIGDTRNTATGPDGTYTFKGIAPGKYRLAAATVGASDGDPLEDYQDVTVNIELQPGDKITKDLKRK